MFPTRHPIQAPRTIRAVASWARAARITRESSKQKQRHTHILGVIQTNKQDSNRVSTICELDVVIDCSWRAAVALVVVVVVAVVDALPVALETNQNINQRQPAKP